MSRHTIPALLALASLAAPSFCQAGNDPPYFINEELHKDAPARNGVSSCDDRPSRTDEDLLQSQATCDTCPGGRAPSEITDTYEDTADPVLLHNGAVSFRATDLAIPGRGINFELTRRYNSKRANEDSVVGFGWEFAYDQRVDFDGDPSLSTTFNAKLQNGNNRIDQYSRQAMEPDFFGLYGVYTRLYYEAPYWVIRARHGSKSYFEYAPIPRRSNSYRLTKVEDASGNTLEFTYHGTGHQYEGRLSTVTDTFGRFINFYYSTVNLQYVRLTTVTDFAGRQVVYSYDNDGNLITARSPVVSSTSGFNDFPNGRTTKYTYHTGTHLLSGIVRPNQVGGQPETPYVTFEYYQNTNGWWLNYVQKQTLGGDEIQYYYEPLDTVPSNNFSAQRMRTQVTDRRGHLTNYYFNHNGNVLLKQEYTTPTAYVETEFEYNEDGEITSIVHPKGNKETRTYITNGQRFHEGNLASITYSRNTATDVDQTTDAITVNFEWEPVFNHLLWRDDPRNTAWKTQFVLDYMEGSATANDPNDVAPAVAAELGISEGDARTLIGPLVLDADLNGDGVGGANGTVLVRGLVVQRIEPSVNLDQAIGDDHQANAEGGSTPNSQEAISTWTYNDYGQVTSQTDAEENVTLFAYTPWNDLDADGLDDVTASSTVAVTGGLPRQTIQDATLPYAGDPQFNAQFSGLAARGLSTDVGRNVGHPSPPAPINRTLDIFFNTYRFPVSFVDGRGVKHEVYLNELGEVWKTRRGVDAAAASARQGGAIEEPNETHISGTAFAYEEKFQRDANGLVVHAYVQNSGETPDDNGYWETTYQYDILNNQTDVHEEKAGGQFVTTHTDYDANENVIQVTTPLGNWTQYEYDYRDQLTKVFRGTGQPPGVQVSERVYDGNGNVITYIDGNFNATTYVIDEFDRVNKVIDAIGNERRNWYDLASNITKAEDWQISGINLTLIRSTLSSYDERSRPWLVGRKSESAGITDGSLTPGDDTVSARIDYDRLSRVTFRTEDDGKVYEAHYDGLSRRVWSKDPAGNIRTGSFDHEGNLVKHTEIDVYPNATTRTFWTWRRYDGLGRLSSLTNQLGETDRYGYDSRDLLVSASDAEAPGAAGQIYTVNVNPPGNTRSYRYDGRGLLLSETMDLRVGGNGAGAIDTSNPYNPDGKVVISQEWDDDGRLFKRFDDNQGSGGNGTFTQYVWDFRNRLKEEVFADQTKIVRTYDGNHNVTGITDARGNVSTSVYDQLDRLRSVTLLSGPSASLGTVGLTFDYDGLGRRTLARSTYIDGTGTHQWDVTRSWDAFDRLLSETQNGKTLASNWAEEAKRTELIYPTSTPLGGILMVGYTFDSLDRVSRIKTNGTDLAAYSYAGPDRKLSRTLRNRTSTRWHDGAYDDTAYYDGAKRITKIDHYNIYDNPNTLLGSFEHAYNRVGSRLWERRVHDGGKGDNYGHDSLYRLTKFERKVPATDIGTLGLGNDESDRTWTLDGVHNWRGFSIDTSNQTSAVDSVHQYTSFGGIVPDYDADGNMTSPDTAGTTTLTYDFLNRLVEVDDGAGATVEHVYDAEGRRVRSLFTGVADAPLQRDYVYDGWEVIEEHELVTNPDPQGQPLQKFMRRYVMGITIDEPVCMEALPGQVGGRTLYYMQSTLGHVVGLTNNVGEVKERYTYDAYGQPRFEDASNVPLATQKSAYGNPYLFTGRRYEPWIVPLYEYRNRFYLPEQGRFVQRDPIGIWGDEVALGSPFAYSGMAAMDLRDPYGLSSDPWGDFLEEWVAPAAGAVTGFLEDTTGGLLGLAGEAIHGDRWTRAVNHEAIKPALETTQKVSEVVGYVNLARSGVKVAVGSVRAVVSNGDSVVKAIVGASDEAVGTAKRAGDDVAPAGMKPGGGKGVDSPAPGSAKPKGRELTGKGKHAGEGTPVKEHGKRPNADERKSVNAEGNKLGCHICGRRTSGLGGGSWVPDHIPPTRLSPSDCPQRLYPSCIFCSRSQGGAVAGELRRQANGGY